LIWVLAIVTVVAMVPAGLRWLRVAQREHYLAGQVNRFETRWIWSSGLNVVLGLVAALGLAGSLFDLRWGFLVPLAQIGPVGLPVRGVSAPLAWTPRLRRLAVFTAVIVLGVVVSGVLVDLALLVVAPLFFLPFIVDVALSLLNPIEKRAGSQWVDKAASKLESVGAEVVAITGSYGKTTTKNYVAHLLSGQKRVVASPASFNNRMGLARAINENLAPGTDVFVAEMGTYGPGEIAELCEWIPPRVAALVSVGPVHLERFKTIESIVMSKAEIFDRAEVGVIGVDDEPLAELARERAGTMRIIEVSTGGGGVFISGEEVAAIPDGVFGTNLAVAIGVCVALGVDLEEILPRVTGLPTAEHRQSVSVAEGGFTIIDNTFNSNPVGARTALRRLIDLADGGKTAVVTPGMVELGPMQYPMNFALARDASTQVDHMVIVGRTNRKALVDGSANGTASVTVVDSRDDAVTWVRSHLGAGDAVLYENDLPDHYP
jgi:UDP-N-acetylmuramoyl-tripeptide--D-alanyl-D-alanine ligase